MLGADSLTDRQRVKRWENRGAVSREIVVNKESLYRNEEQLRRYDTNEGWTRMEPCLNKEINAVNNKMKLLRQFVRYGIASAIIVGICGGYLFFRPDGDSVVISATKSDEIVLALTNGQRMVVEKGVDITDMVYNSNTDNLTKTNEIQYNRIVVPVGKDFTFVMPDGSTIWLLPDSELRFADNFGQQTREVFLTGEAYFSVVKKENMPFKVVADNMNITVLGTKFNVRSYPDESITYSTLLEGSVCVNSGYSDAKSKTLVPGQQAALRSDDNQIDTYDVNIDSYIGLLDNRFVFIHKSMEEVMRALSKWYAFNFEILDPQIASMTISCNLKMDSSINSILSKICQTGGIDFIQNNSMITITGNK